jgi:hypothetical protein
MNSQGGNGTSRSYQAIFAHATFYKTHSCLLELSNDGHLSTGAQTHEFQRTPDRDECAERHTAIT